MADMILAKRMHSKVTNTVSLIIIMFCAVLHANAQNTSAPKSFLIAAHVISEGSPAWLEDLIDIEPDNSGSIVRRFRISPVSDACPNNVAIYAEERRLNLPVERLIDTPVPCSLHESDFRQTIDTVSLQRRDVNSGISYTIIAGCGSEDRVFRIPNVQTLDVGALRRQSASGAQLLDLYSVVAKRVFANDTLNAPKPSKRRELEANAQKLLPLLKSGRFDRAFDGDFLPVALTRYLGPSAVIQSAPKLVDANNWRFVSYVDPLYPQPAKRMPMDAKVDLELVVDPTSGRIRSLKILKGDPSFTQVTTDAVIQWVFDPAQRFPTPLRVTLDYSTSCKAAR